MCAINVQLTVQLNKLIQSNIFLLLYRIEVCLLPTIYKMLLVASVDFIFSIFIKPCNCFAYFVKLTKTAQSESWRWGTGVLARSSLFNFQQDFCTHHYPWEEVLSDFLGSLVIPILARPKELACCRRQDSSLCWFHFCFEHVSSDARTLLHGAILLKYCYAVEIWGKMKQSSSSK